MDILNNTYRHHGIFTTDREWAEWIIDGSIGNKNSIVKHISTKNSIKVVFKDKSCIEWIQPSTTVRGFRLTKISIDLATCSKECIERVVMPLYRVSEESKYDVFDSDYRGNKQYDLNTLIDRLEKYRLIFGNMMVETESYDNSLPLTSIELQCFGSKDVINISGSLID